MIKCKVVIPFIRRIGANRTNHNKGSIVVLSPTEAQRMRAAGIVEIIETLRPAPAVETATLPEGEQAVAPSRRSRRK